MGEREGEEEGGKGGEGGGGEEGKRGKGGGGLSSIIFILKDSMNNIYIGVPSFSKQSQPLFLIVADQAMHVCRLIPFNFSHRGHGIAFPPSS